MNKQKNYLQKLSRFFFIVLITICLTRIWAISLFYIFNKNGQLFEKIVNDKIHHYQLGLVFILFAFLLYKFRKFKILLPIGLGILLEEWPVFLNDLGFRTIQLYQTKVDFMIAFGVIGYLYVISRFMARFTTKYIFSIILIFSAYHFIRDILQSMAIHSPFIDIYHRPHFWCRPICDIVTFPLDLLGIIGSLVVLKRNKVGLTGSLVLVSLPLWLIAAFLP